MGLLRSLHLVRLCIPEALSRVVVRCRVHFAAGRAQRDREIKPVKHVVAAPVVVAVVARRPTAKHLAIIFIATISQAPHPRVLLDNERPPERAASRLAVAIRVVVGDLQNA